MSVFFLLFTTDVKTCVAQWCDAGGQKGLTRVKLQGVRSGNSKMSDGESVPDSCGFFVVVVVERLEHVQARG